MTEKVQIEMLTEDTVSVVTIKSIEIDGKEYEIDRTRRGYNNSPLDREALTGELGEPYTSAILAIWGESTTVNDPPQPTMIEESEVDGTAEN